MNAFTRGNLAVALVSLGRARIRIESIQRLVPVGIDQDERIAAVDADIASAIRDIEGAIQLDEMAVTLGEEAAE